MRIVLAVPVDSEGAERGDRNEGSVEVQLVDRPGVQDHDREEDTDAHPSHSRPAPSCGQSCPRGRREQV